MSEQTIFGKLVGARGWEVAPATASVPASGSAAAESEPPAGATNAEATAEEAPRGARARKAARHAAKAGQAAAAAAGAVGKAAGTDLPPPRIPANLDSWLLFAGFLFCTYVSWLTTADFFAAAFGANNPLWSLAAQLIFFAVERRLFRGEVSLFTLFVLALDAALTAAGLFIGTLPRILGSPQVQTLATTAGYEPPSTEGPWLVFWALAAASILAWASDALYHMAVHGRR
jgi:hypothetical protein